MMPFFQGAFNKENVRNKKLSLQVRILLMMYGDCEKRASSSGPSLYGSLTVEATLSLSLFLFAMVILISPMKLLNEHRKMFTALEAACEDVSEYAYIADEISRNKEQNRKGIPEGLAAGITEAGAVIYAQEKIKKAVNPNIIKQFSMARSSVLEDGETIDFIVDCRLKLPVSIFQIKSVPVTVRSRRRAWIGREGVRGQSDVEIADDDTIVYIGRYSTRYHRLRTCHYLHNDISAVSFDLIQSLRNQNGRRYVSCARCGAAAGPGSTVYIMPGGESYHSDMYCSSIVAYVRAVPLSQVKDLGPCSYCSE